MDYLNSGVDVNKGNSFVSIIKDITKNKNIGGFSGIYEYNNIKLVASTDGVGTKLELCKKINKYDTIGIDLVAMCVNDIICQGAKPLFFLDYYAMGKLNLEIGKDIINGINIGCNESECLLLGGETAEMPIIYKDKDFDLAGFSVGIIENDIFPKNMEEGDLIYGIQSSGVHSNGFSLVRHILKKKTNSFLPPHIKKELIKPTKIYVKELNKINKKKLINGCANITGGGLLDNLIRVVPENLCLNIDLSKIKTKSIFRWLKKNNIKDSEMLKTFNCGVGFCLITNKRNVNKIKKIFSREYQPYQIGFISKEKSKIKTFGKLQW